MKFPNRLTKCLNYQLDFSTYFILEVIPRRKKNTVILIAPKFVKGYTYFGMLLNNNGGHWYPNYEQMLDAAVRLGYISGLKRILIRHRCKRIYATIQNNNQ